MSLTPKSNAYFKKQFTPLIQKVSSLDTTRVGIYGLEPRFSYLDFILDSAGTALPNIVAFFDRNYKGLQGSPLTNIAPIYGPGSIDFCELDVLLVLPRANESLQAWLNSFRRKQREECVFVEPDLVEDLLLDTRHYINLKRSELYIAAEQELSLINYPSKFAARNFQPNDGYLDNSLYWNIRALTHDSEVYEIQSDSKRDYRIFIAEILEQFTEAGDRILDFGCGPGHSIKFNQTRVADRDYRGADISWRQVEVAKKNLGTEIPIDRINGLSLDYEDKQFRLSYTSSVFDHICYPEVLYYAKEICRVSKDYIFLMEPANNVVSGYNSDCFGDGYHFDHNYKGLFESLGFELIDAFPTLMGSNLVGMLFKRS